MNIYGLQKVTLLDFPGHVACTVFLSGCNFDCPYCHNKAIVHHETKPIMREKTFFEWLEKKKGKLDGVCISGGEPTLHGQLNSFIREIKARGFLVKLDTNGYKPESLKSAIYEAKVDYVAMDIKNSPGKYCATTGLKVIDLSKIKDSVEIIMESGIEYEFRTTVTASMHNEADFRSIGMLLDGAEKYFLQKCTTDTPSDIDLMKYKKVMEQYVKNVKIRG